MRGPTPEGVFEVDAVVIGGCGHVGLPLAVALASLSYKLKRILAFIFTFGTTDIFTFGTTDISRGLVDNR